MNRPLYEITRAVVHLDNQIREKIRNELNFRKKRCELPPRNLKAFFPDVL